jgi:hypothetical protein
VIGKVCRRGTDVCRLLGYLFLEGQAGERGLASDHTDAHLVAGYAELTSLEPERRADGRANVRRLAALLQAPVLAGNVAREAKPVYHLAISAAKTDRQLSDVEWADIAAEYVHRLGLAPRGDDQAVRWVAVRHARDHVHVVATLVRQDGRRVFPRQDYLRSREASRTIEARYGLTTTAPVGGTSTPETTRAERRKHHEEIQRRRRQGRPDPAGPDRELLRARVRDALTATNSWNEFADWLNNDGVLVRPRMSTLQPGEITGYAVALRPTGRDINRRPVWFSGGKLAPDLTLPRLQQRWATTTRASSPPTRDAAGRAAHRATHAVAAAERDLHVTATQVGPGPAADTAAAASDVLHAVSRLLEWKRPGPLRQAADDYDRATRPARRSRAPSTPAGRALRVAACGLALARLSAGADLPPLVQLLEQLAALADAVAALRRAQDQLARAAAARAAAESLHAEAAHYRALALGTPRPATHLGRTVATHPLEPPPFTSTAPRGLSR